MSEPRRSFPGQRVRCVCGTDYEALANQCPDCWGVSITHLEVEPGRFEHLPRRDGGEPREATG